ncbi:immunity 70 family protein [Pontibacillus marinus]|uniref:Immunity protein 70 n=1 Tax=Pontibacillus marinus BH030004 = DSM 16465 TaxID=1385511 RepID=A0A0A5GGS8_9BACI|nr:immunity 70 family protein [Pontibacillus marinus]KGX91209.1 hypothetical protein N783_10955 [Pontibacillus marinus BH030004 = DSM 16465]
MAVGFKIDFLWYQVGHGDFLHSFFSTISYHLEPNGWGSEYPYLMNELYQGKLSWKDVPKALTEVGEVRSKLKSFTPDKVIWDIEDTSKQPPWGQNISSTITSLANYFVTSDGRDMFEVLVMALKDAEYEKVDIEIESI